MKLYNLKDYNEQVSLVQAIKQGLGKQQGLFFPAESAGVRTDQH